MQLKQRKLTDSEKRRNALELLDKWLKEIEQPTKLNEVRYDK